MGFLNEKQLANMGFKSVGIQTLISDKAVFYGIENISIGDRVRIDDFCLLSACNGFIEICNFIHIAAYTALYGSAGIVMEDFSAASSHTSVYSAGDSYKGDCLLGPVVDKEFRNVVEGIVTFRKYSSVGSHAVVLPGVTLEEGAILGACSLGVKNLKEWTLYSGIPAKELRPRDKAMIEKGHLQEKKWQEQLAQR